MKQLKQMEEKLTLRNWSIDFSLENEYSKVYDEDGEREYPEISSTSIDAENIVALSISTLHFLKANYPNYSYSSNELIDIYCIHRIYIKTEIYNIDDNINVNIMNDYYQERMTTAYFTGIYAEVLENHFKNIFSFQENYKKINYLLNLEYGKILPQLRGPYSISIEECPSFDLIKHNKEVFAKVEEETNYYSLWLPSIPLGILTKKNGNQYHLIDGYHRLINNKTKTRLVLVINRKEN